MKIILLNGPPGSGKNEVFKIMADRRSYSDQIVEEMKFAKPLDSIAKACLPFIETDADFMHWREDFKETPLMPGSNASMRDLLIGISEDLIKPLFGQEYFGKVAADAVLRRIEALTDDEWKCPNNVIVFTDSGFQVEYDVFTSSMKRHHIPYDLVRITRPGKTFEGDSRQYVTDCGLDHIRNDGKISDLARSVYSLMDSLGV